VRGLVNIYEHGHWEGLKFVLNQEEIHTTVDFDGVTDHGFRALDFSHAEGVELASQEDLDFMVAAFLDPENSGFQVE
jgi:hypothetical protein